MERIELVFYKCPKCKRELKPSMDKDLIQTRHLDPHGKILEEVKSPDMLICRYCNISVKVSLLRKQKDPIKFLENFKNIPIGFSMSEDTKEKIRLKEEHEYNMQKYKHYPIPNKCPQCKSKDIVADCSDHGWICIPCDEYFGWHSFRVRYSGDIEVEAENQDMASEKAYHYLEKGVADIETDVDWM